MIYYATLISALFLLVFWGVWVYMKNLPRESIPLNEAGERIRYRILRPPTNREKLNTIRSVDRELVRRTQRRERYYDNLIEKINKEGNEKER